MSVRDTVKQFVTQNFYVSDPGALGDETSLIAEGYVDSTGMLEVIAFLEHEFGVRVSDEETTPENLETIGRIAAFVERKRAAA
jgi:acyl carrier protein